MCSNFDVRVFDFGFFCHIKGGRKWPTVTVRSNEWVAAGCWHSTACGNADKEMTRAVAVLENVQMREKEMTQKDI